MDTCDFVGEYRVEDFPLLCLLLTTHISISASMFLPTPPKLHDMKSIRLSDSGTGPRTINGSFRNSI